LARLAPGGVGLPRGAATRARCGLGVPPAVLGHASRDLVSGTPARTSAYLLGRVEGTAVVRPDLTRAACRRTDSAASSSATSSARLKDLGLRCARNGETTCSMRSTSRSAAALT